MPVPSPLPPPESAGHRERLLAGMAGAIRDRGGFASTTVAEVVRRARTSRRTFYEHFEDREACFLALADEVAERLMTAIAAAATGEGDFAVRVDRAIAAYLGTLAAEPAVARACIQEIPAIGPRGTARVAALNERFARLIVALTDDARRDDPALRALPLEVATVITGGFRDLVLAAFEQGRDPVELQPVAADLIRRLAAA